MLCTQILGERWLKRKMTNQEKRDKLPSKNINIIIQCECYWHLFQGHISNWNSNYPSQSRSRGRSPSAVFNCQTLNCMKQFFSENTRFYSIKEAMQTFTTIIFVSHDFYLVVVTHNTELGNPINSNLKKNIFHFRFTLTICLISILIFYSNLPSA